MICHCGATALYQVGAKGFCRAHYADGVAAQKRYQTEHRLASIRREISNDRGRTFGWSPKVGTVARKSCDIWPKHITPEQASNLRFGAASKKRAAARRQPPPTSGASQ